MNNTFGVFYVLRLRDKRVHLDHNKVLQLATEDVLYVRTSPDCHAIACTCRRMATVNNSKVKEEKGHEIVRYS